MTTKKPDITSLAYVGFYINAAISKGHGDAITFDEVYRSLEKGTLLEDLSAKIPGEFDFSLFPPGSEQSLAINAVLHEVAGGLQGRERRKVGVERSGLHLLIAFILEAMQHQQWVIRR